MTGRFKLFLILLAFSTYLFAEDNIYLEEDVKKTNEKILFLKKDLKRKYAAAGDLYAQKASIKEYETLLNEVKKIKTSIKEVEDSFRKDVIQESLKTDEGYAFWDQGETSISELIQEYGSQDYLYVVPYDLGKIKINLFSTIPIPRESWEDMIKLILSQNGIGIKKLNPFLCQLYVMKHDPAHIEAIVSSQNDLEMFQDSAYLAYVFVPAPERLKSTYSFLERFSDMKHTTVHAIKTNIIVVGSKSTIERLLNLYTAVFEKGEGKVIKVVSLSKIDSSDAEKILKTFFLENATKTRAFYQGSMEQLNILLAGKSSIILIGEDTLVEKAEKVILDLENQLDDPAEMTIFNYTCKHSDPEELASILEKLYFSINAANSGKEKEALKKVKKPLSLKTKYKETTTTKASKGETFSNFVVDGKTNSILMVIRKDEKENIKALLKQLDVPKKMVQIDVLLVERKIQDRKKTGINLLRIGAIQGKRESSISFDAASSSKRKGLLDLLLSRPKGKIPAFDIAMSFLMAQDDMRISDCPTVLAVNQTPAKISVVDEISINNGAIQIDTSSGPKLEKSFSRAQFGTTIVLTPTIHMPDEEIDGAKGFVTLHTDVSFDTTKSFDNDRPAVTRRHIENEVRVADGETIILGGLRRKTNEEGSEKIPFLGEIPGIGKLFGSTKKATSSSEMFIFITPHIIKNPEDNLLQVKNKLSEIRQGDSEAFLSKLENAKKEEKRGLFENSIKLFFER